LCWYNACLLDTCDTKEIERLRKNIKSLEEKLGFTQQLIQIHKNVQVHDEVFVVFVDNSNIMIGGKNENKKDQLSISQIVDIVEKNRKHNILVRGVVGSVTRSSHKETWQKQWEDNGYTVLTSTRAHDTGKEQYVDEALHSMMYNHIFDDTYAKYTKKTVILLSGDGNDHVPLTSNFPKIVERAVKHGWNAEIWSWEICCSSRLKRLQTQYPNTVKVFFLDKCRNPTKFKKNKK